MRECARTESNAVEGLSSRERSLRNPHLGVALWAFLLSGSMGLASLWRCILNRVDWSNPGQHRKPLASRSQSSDCSGPNHPPPYFDHLSQLASAPHTHRLREAAESCLKEGVRCATRNRAGECVRWLLLRVNAPLFPLLPTHKYLADRLSLVVIGLDYTSRRGPRPLRADAGVQPAALVRNKGGGAPYQCID